VDATQDKGGALAQTPNIIIPDPIPSARDVSARVPSSGEIRKRSAAFAARSEAAKGYQCSVLRKLID
jgi:hypothetical protein